MFRTFLLTGVTAALVSFAAFADSSHHAVSDDVIARQRAALAAATQGKGFGPQSPRDIGMMTGSNHRVFGTAPDVSKMTLCDIHFHENAEHKGGSYTTFAGNGDGYGFGTGFKYDGKLTEAELAPIGMAVGASEHGDLEPGDTIEIHFVYSTAQASLGNGLGTCLSDAVNNPQLRVEAVVAVLVSEGGADFARMAEISEVDGLNQVPGLPTDLGDPVIYAGSTTGPGYNEKGSPFQVTWSVRPDVVKLGIASVDTWLKDNPFDEGHAHGVRNLVTNPDLLSPIN
ncbi:delta-class carbonic anhydrase [Thalassospira sp. CH_XMU1448-2]|uniref:delta-class carbonic anhydrase n=1 Tax=Thalassospira sp. CH_XMU1448-2 TaxID=3107773 RepID=UPI00300A494A